MPLYPQLELGQIAEVFVGVARHGRIFTSAEGTSANLIGMKALRGEGINFEAVETVHLASGVDLSLCAVAENDILMPCRGTDLRLVLVSARAAGMLIDSNVLAIRCRPGLHPKLLATYFKHPAGNALLEGASQSTTSQKNLTVRVVKKILVPVPPLEVQENMIALLQTAERLHEVSTLVAEKRLALARQIAVSRLLTGEATRT